MAKTIVLGSILCGIAVITGAFGAHGLEALLKEYGRVDTYETAVLYHFIHAIALIIVGIIGFHKENKWLKWAVWSFGLGILLFSGSLYVLCLTNIGILGAITPFGGVLFIMGWGFTALGSK